MVLRKLPLDPPVPDARIRIGPKSSTGQHDSGTVWSLCSPRLICHSNSDFHHGLGMHGLVSSVGPFGSRTGSSSSEAGINKFAVASSGKTRSGLFVFLSQQQAPVLSSCLLRVDSSAR